MLVRSGSKLSSSDGLVRSGFTFLAAAFLAWNPWLALLAAEAPQRVDFNFQVRPILADRCFKCHGPDEKARKAKLRLDLPENAYALRDPKNKHERSCRSTRSKAKCTGA